MDHATENASSPYRCVDRDDRVQVAVGWVLIQALMWTVSVEVMLVLTEHGAGVLLVIDQNPVGALRPDATDEAFRDGVGPRCPRWSLDHGNAFGREYRVEGPDVFRVPIPNQEPKCANPIAQIHHQVARLLGSPCSGRVGGHPEDVNPAGGDLHDKQYVQPPQRHGVEVEEIRREQPGRLRP